MLNHSRFIQGLRYSGYITLAVGILFAVVWLVIFRTLAGFPLDSLTLGLGGLFWIVAGCIGPGRYKPVLPLALYNPRDKGSYYKYIKISGFITDESIHTAKILVDGTEVGELEFVDHVAELVLKDSDLPKGTVHTVWLESVAPDKIYYSNKHLFTLYDPKDFTEEEVVEIEAQESKLDLPIADAYQRYIEDKHKGYGSLSLGFFAAGLAVFAIGLVYTAIFT